MIDLHIHTNCSDGVKEPSEILKIANDLNLECISITDHDTCMAYEIIQNSNIRSIYNGKIIVGCELRTSFNKIPIEILGYNVNPNIINEWRNEYYSEENVLIAKNNNLEQLMNNCKNVGLVFDDNIRVDNVKQSFAYDLFNAIKQFEENKKYFNNYEWISLETFLRKYCGNPKSELFIDRSNNYPSISEIVDIIKTAGGISFLAHPYEYGAENIIQFVDSIIKDGKLDGIECYYTKFTTSQTEEVLNYCIKNNLLISGGSDFHGTSSKSEVKLGVGFGDLDIPFGIIKDWAKFI